MLLNMDDIKPRNETFEHFFLKQVARAFLFSKGVRCIATEVNIFGHDFPPFGKPKYVVDVLGIDRRKKVNELANKIYDDILDEALKIGKERGLATESYNRLHWVNTYRIRNPRDKLILEKRIEQCIEDACEKKGYPRDIHKKLKREYQEEYTMWSVESKVSYSDFKNGFSMCAEYSYVIAPKGIVPVEELPNKVGLLEFDFNKYYDTGKWEEALEVTKRHKKVYDSRFLFEKGNQRSFNKIEHAIYCYEKLTEIAQQNTEEHIFWNPWLRQVEEGYMDDKIYKFKCNIGDRTPKGIVIDRKVKRKDTITFYGHGCKFKRFDEFYKLVVEGEGITDWILYEDIIK